MASHLLLQDLRFFFYGITTSHNENYINMTLLTSCKLNTRENPCEYSTGMHFVALKQIARPFVHIKITDLKENKIVADQLILLCVLRGVNGLSLIIQVLWEQAIKEMDFKMTCPFKTVS